MMTQGKKIQLLKVSLILFAIVTLVYGVVYLLMPGLYLNTIGGENIHPAWIRWSGGILIAHGVAAIMVFRNPGKQGIFIFMSALGTLLLGLTNLYSIFFEHVGGTWGTLAPAIVILILSSLLWISLKQASSLLWDDKE